MTEKYKESKLESLIRQDVENGTFHAQNIFSDEYLKPQFYKYVKKLEVEKEELRKDKDLLMPRNIELVGKVARLEEENEELKEMFEFVCKQRFGYAWNMNKDVYIADIKKALKGEKTQWV